MSKNVGNNHVTSYTNNSEVIGNDETTEDEEDVNDIVLDEQGFRNMVTISQVQDDGSLRKYLVRLKKDGEIRWYICNYCSKKFKKPSDLIRHIRVHTKEKPYKCHYCKTTFSLKSTLITHIMNTHSINRQFKCTMCDRTFNTLRLLNTHLWKHDLVIPPKFQCVTCGFLCVTEEIGSKHKSDMKESNCEHIIEPFDIFSSKSEEMTEETDKDDKPVSENSTVFTCHVCPQKFSKKIHLLRHLTYHPGEKNHCQLCKRVFPTSEKLREHLDNHNVKQYECKQCIKKFANALLLKRHMKVHSNYIIRRMKLKKQQSENNTNPCNISECQLTENEQISKSESGVKEGEGSHVLVPYMMAPLNDLHILNLDGNVDPNLQKLYVSVNNEHLESGDMNIAFPVQENLNIQANDDAVQQAENEKELVAVSTADEPVRTTSVISRTVTKNRPNIIRSSFNQSKSSDQDINYSKNIPNQIESENVNAFQQFSINGFNSQSGSVIDLKDSRSFLENANIICINCSGLHSNFKDFQNHVCNAGYPNKNEMDLGEQENYTEALKENTKSRKSSKSDVFHHPTRESPEKVNKEEPKKRKKQLKPIECHLCKRTFTERIEYKNHLKIHSKARRYECSICKKLIIGRISYMKHLNDSHSDENGSMLRSCKYCSKEFKKPSDLARHLRVHTGEKPFTCEECKRNFSLKSTLESHMRTHKPIVRPFNCLICNLNFTTKATLKVHLTIHTGAKPFKCLFCDMSFRTSGHRKSHVVVAHISHRRKHAESRKAKIRRMLESVASTILNDMESEQRTSQELEDNMMTTAEITKSVQEVPSDSLEATMAAVHSITEPTASDNPTISPNELMNHLVSIDPPVNIDRSLTNNLTVAIDPSVTNPVIRDSHTPSTIVSTDQIVPIDMIVHNEQMVSAHVINADSLVNDNSAEPTTSLDHAVSINTNHLATSDLTIRSEENVLNSISTNGLTVDTVSLLQQLQPSGVVISSENEDESIPLILDDVTLLNIELSGENMQIISLSDLDSSIIQTQPTHSEQDSLVQKPQKMRNQECYICNKMYASKDVLRKHIKTVHFKDGFLCCICNKKFDQKRKLDVHMQEHNDNGIIDQDAHVFLQDQQPSSSKIIPNVQYDLLTENIGDALFANLFSIKKTK